MREGRRKKGKQQAGSAWLTIPLHNSRDLHSHKLHLTCIPGVRCELCSSEFCNVVALVNGTQEVFNVCVLNCTSDN